MQIHLNQGQVKAEIFVVLAKEASGGAKKPAPIFGTKSIPDFLATEIKGKKKEVCIYRNHSLAGATHFVVVGLGQSPTTEDYRVAGAQLWKTLSAAHIGQSVAIDFELFASKKGDIKSVIAFMEGLRLASYQFDELKSKKEESKANWNFQLLTKLAKDRGAVQEFAGASSVIDCVQFSRRLGDMPGNLMTPSILADEVVARAKGTQVKVTVWDKKRIEKEKMGGLLGVAQGSAEEPRFIIMEYKGGRTADKPLVFVGKGLTFDTGGISLKPGAAMEEMKYDMCGGANVIGSVFAIAALKLKINVIGLIPSTENMPGSRATKPGDVHRARNGKTFEVNNTDAEGRLILSDALSYACELKPKMIIDAATLTGAMVMALGNIHTGFFTRNEALATRIKKAGETSGEKIWHMPLTDEHVEDMKGTFADLNNISSGKGAGSATAAAFLEQFVDSEIPWAHFDIAGTAWAVGGRLNYCPAKGASGVIIRTFVEIAKSL